MSALGVLALLAAVGAQPALRDPYLPDSVREVVEKASAAELDPKRGTTNAIEALKSERKKYADGSREAAALDLRVAGTILRTKFNVSQEFKEEIRPVQALSTYSRLDLWEPGLKVWLDRAFDKNPEIKKKLAKKSLWKWKVAVLTRGSGLDKDAIAQAFKKALEKVGMAIELVPMAEAEMAMILSAEDAPLENSSERAVKVTFGAERIQDKKVVWRTQFFRVESARDSKVALASALEWTARIGGRDLFFRWLGENAFPPLADPNAPGAGIAPAGEHDHAPTRVQIPKKP